MPILNENSFELISRSPEQTRRVGARLGSLSTNHELICLYGELGSGKTTFVQGVSQGWGSSDMVTSPTFVLVNHYRRPDGAEMHHLDAYRLKDAQDAIDMDIDYLLNYGVLLVEWPERILDALPKENLWIELYWIADEQRRLVFLPHGEQYIEMAGKLRQQLYGSGV